MKSCFPAVKKLTDNCGDGNVGRHQTIIPTFRERKKMETWDSKSGTVCGCRACAKITVGIEGFGEGV